MLKQVQHDRPLIDFVPKLTVVSTYFDKINFDKLPNAFVIKTNHGCKWQYIIKDKKEFLQNKQLFETVKQNITGWLEQDYSFWNWFEMQYHGIEPKILIEPYMSDDINKPPEEIHVYCFSGVPKYIIKLHNENEITIYNEKFEITDDVFGFEENKINVKADCNIKKTFYFSEQLSKAFHFVRMDWIVFQNNPYFAEMTFTPYSGFHILKNDKELGKLII